jgi:cytochrome P450
MDKSAFETQGPPGTTISIHPFTARELWYVAICCKGWKDADREQGGFVRISPTEIAIADMDAFRAIHKVGSGFNKADWYVKFNDSPQPGIFAMIDPKQHAARRRLFAQAFANSSIVTYEAVIRAKIDTAVSKIRRDASSGAADILKWFTFMTTDVMGELSFGKSFDMLQKEEASPRRRDIMNNSDTLSTHRKLHTSATLKQP